jgi:hypothetical protein
MKSVQRASLDAGKPLPQPETPMEPDKKPRIRILDIKLGDATDFVIDNSFNADIPVPIYCKSCGMLLHADWRYQRLLYRHPKQPNPWCTAPTPYVVSPHGVLEATLRAVLHNAPPDPEETISARLRRWVVAVYVEASSYEQCAIRVEVRKPDDRKSAA